VKKNILLVLLVLFFASAGQSHALKKRVWNYSKVAIASGSKPSVGARLSSDRQSIVITFRQVLLTTSVTYELTYLGNDLEQGIFGTVKPEEGNLVSRTLYFGTCSKNVCTPHRNLKNGILLVSYRLQNCTSFSQKFRVRL